MTKTNVQAKEVVQEQVVELTKRKAATIDLSQKDWEKIKKDNELTTWSQQIRYLAANYPHPDTKIAHIANFLGKRPQHVSNVLRTPIKTK